MTKKEFASLYDQYAPRIYRFIYFKVNSEQDSEDLASEAFLNFWRSFGRKKEEKVDNPQALLYKIAGNLVIDFYRKKAKSEIMIDPANDRILSQAKDKTDLSREIGLGLEMERVKQVLGQLKDDYQNVIIWRFLDDLSIKEIAQITGKPESSVRVSVHRAVNAVKKKL